MSPERKTIAVITPYFPPHGGGLERYANEIASRLAKGFQWRVIVITSGERNGVDAKEEMNGLTVYRLSYRLKFSNTPFSFGWYAKIRAIFAAEQPDVINLHMPVPGIGDLATLLAGKTPVVVTYHAGSMNKNLLVPDVLIWFYEHGPLRLLLRRANRIVCASDFVRFSFLKRYLYKTVTITPGVDSELFKADPSKKTARPTVLFVAGLGYAEQHKELNTLLNAIAIIKKSIPDIYLMIAGGGDMREVYEANAKKLGLGENVSFEGRLAGQELAEKYQAANVFVLPSSNENFSMAILEAMSSKLPVVATNVGGLPLLVQDGKTGLLVEPKNAQALAEKIATLLHDPKMSAAFGNAGYERVIAEFDWRRRTERYNDLFVQALGKRLPHVPRLIIVAPYFFPKIGGLETIAFNIARRLHERGEYRVSIITSNHETSGYREDIINGMKVYRLPITMKISNTPIGVTWHWWIKRILAVERPDIINLHSPVPFMADVAAMTASYNTPIVLTYHSGSMRKGKWQIDILIRLYERILLRMLFRRANAIVASYPDFINRDTQEFKEKIYNIPPGVDLTQFSPSPLRHNQEIVTFVGRIERNSTWKGIAVLLNAMAIVIKMRPQARLVIVGGGDAIEIYQEMAKKLSIANKVSFVGPKNGPELADSYGQATVVVLPSTSDAESFGMVLAEAMASGRPIIGSNIGGIPRLIDHEKNGLLVAPGNPEELASAINKVLTNRSLLEQFAKASIIKAQQFGWEIQMEKYRSLFAKVLMNKPAIAQIVPYYPPHLGGMEVVAKEIATELAQRKYSVTVVTSNIGSDKAPLHEITPNYQVRRLRSLEIAHTPLAWTLPFRLLALPKNSVIHVHIAQAGFPEVALIAAKIRNFPLIAHFHLDVGPSGPLGNIFLFYKKHFLARVLRAANKVIVFSDEQATLIKDKYGIHDSAIAVIPNGVSQKFFTGELRQTPHAPLRLLYVGRLAIQKRVERLIEAMKLINIPAHLTIVGDGEDRAKLEALVTEHGLTNVSFEGRKDGQELREYYRNADIFLTSSDREGMSLVALEAMASGLPIIGTDVIGTHELIAGAGILVNEPYPEHFAKAITEIANDPNRLRELSKQITSRAQDYSLKTVIDKMEVIYKEVTS